MATNSADGLFKCIFVNENVWISLKTSQKFVPKVQINNIPAMVQIMACHWLGDKSVSVLVYMYIGQVTKLQLSCYLVLLSIDSKTR